MHFQCVLAGKFGPYDLKLGSSLHIKDTVQHELSRLLKWSESSAKSFLDQFHDNLVDIMLTGFIGEEHVPPLDHKDGVVFAHAMKSGILRASCKRSLSHEISSSRIHSKMCLPILRCFIRLDSWNFAMRHNVCCAEHRELRIQNGLFIMRR